MGYNETTLAQTSVLDLTPNGNEGSIWMAGAGLAADTSGNIYFLDANGTFDTTLDGNGFPTNHEFGNAFMKVSTASSSLSAAEYSRLRIRCLSQRTMKTLVLEERSFCRTCRIQPAQFITWLWGPEKIPRSTS